MYVYVYIYIYEQLYIYMKIKSNEIKAKVLEAPAARPTPAEWTFMVYLDADNNLEGVISASYSLFFYDSPKTDLTTTIVLYPSLTTRGRLRRNFSINLSHELFSDFFIKLTYNTSHDSDPPSESASTSDYNIITSIGIKF